MQQALASASAQARAAADDARAQWAVADEIERRRWAVKWAAATPDNRIEHIWVRPVNWSPFRIEGILLATPVRALPAGQKSGDIVSFPIEELSDWIHPLSDDPAGPFEGGFTVKVLQERLGKPRGL